MALAEKDNYPKVTPPWSLSGHGYVLLFHFPPAFVASSGFIPSPLKDAFAGGVGAVMLADYANSPVGSYQELLFIPGRFSVQGRRAYSITKIYVSTMVSLGNGRDNWAIPKELATFKVFKKNDVEQINVLHQGHEFLRLAFTASSFKIPVTTALLPAAWRTLVQQHKGMTYLTRPAGTGHASFAKLHEVTIDSNYFPDFTVLKPLMVIKVRQFDLVFPEPTITQA